MSDPSVGDRRASWIEAGAGADSDVEEQGLGIDDGRGVNGDVFVDGLALGEGAGDGGFEELDADALVEASAGDGDGVGLVGAVGIGIEALDPEGGSGGNFGEGGDAGGAGAVKGGGTGGHHDGSGVVVVAGGSGDAGGVEALEALGAVGVAAEDSGGADGGSVSFSAGEKGLEESDDFFGGAHGAAPPARGSNPWLPEANNRPLKGATPPPARGRPSSSLISGASDSAIRTNTDRHGRTRTGTDITGVAPGCRWPGSGASGWRPVRGSMRWMVAPGFTWQIGRITVWVMAILRARRRFATAWASSRFWM